MPKTPLPEYNPKMPLLRGHIVDAAKLAYNTEERDIWGEIWVKVLESTGVHPLEPVPVELLNSLSEEALQYVKGALEHINREKRINPSKNKKHAKRKSGTQ